MLPRALSPLDQNHAFNHFLVQLMLCHYANDKPGALAAALRGRQYMASGGFGIYPTALFVFWEALIYLWAVRTAAPDRGAALWRARRGRAKMARWAKSAPMNYEHKLQLIDAELFRLRGKPDRAALHYERAIELAQTHGFVQDAALAQELAAEFYLDRGMIPLGRHYLRECQSSLRRWGATSVLRRLEQTYPQHFVAFGADASERSSSLSLHPPANLDYRVLLEAFQTISAELRAPGLLERLLRTMFEHAGAQRALLVLDRGGQLYVDAEADVDRDTVDFLTDEHVESSRRLSSSMVRYVAHTGKPLVLADATQDERFAADPYVVERRPRSVLITPMTYQGRLYGLAYLENNRVSHVFTQARLEVAGLLATQAAISIATARFHAVELEAQQAKINPHFLFNALDSIAELALRDGATAERAIVQLARIYRYVLVTSMEELVTLDQELETVRSYLDLERLRLGSKLEVSITCNAAARGVKVPGLLIQPLAENSVRHGISPRSGPGRVWIDATANDEECTIVVQDDGDGSPSASGTGFGLRSVQERLSLVFGNRFTFAITRDGGYRTEITIPVSAGSDSVARTRLALRAPP
jgi:GAF domain-containing protein